MPRGGRREGAGRKIVAPDLKKRSLTVRLSDWVLDSLDRKFAGESKGNLVEHAVIKTYGLNRNDDG